MWRIQKIGLGRFAPGVVIIVQSDNIYMYDVQTYRYLLILHHDKLKLRWACEQPKWILDYQARLRVITEPTGKEPIQAQPEKKTTSVAKGQWYPRPIIRLMHRSRTQYASELSHQRRRTNANDMNVAFVKPDILLVLWYNFTSVKIGSTPPEEVGELSTCYCPDCTLVVEQALGFRGALTRVQNYSIKVWYITLTSSRTHVQDQGANRVFVPPADGDPPGEFGLALLLCSANR